MVFFPEVRKTLQEAQGAFFFFFLPTNQSLEAFLYISWLQLCHVSTPKPITMRSLRTQFLAHYNHNSLLGLGCTFVEAQGGIQEKDRHRTKSGFCLE